MHPKKLKLNHKVKKKYLQFIQSQEILSEPFRDKLVQLNKFFLPMSKKIYDHRIKNNKTIIVGLLLKVYSASHSLEVILSINS